MSGLVRIKPNTADETTIGDYDVFNGGESTDDVIVRHRTTHDNVAGIIYISYVTNRSYIALYKLFHSGGPNRGIGYPRSRAVALIHEAIHLLGVRDEDFGGSQNLTTFIIKSCIDKDNTVADLSFRME